MVAANDNHDTLTGGTEAATSALVTFEAEAGATYHFQVDGKATGTTPPANAPFTLTLNDSLWQGLTGGSVTSAPVVGPDGAVYVGSTDGTLHAFNADGSRRWPALRLEGMLDTSAAALSPDGTLYLGVGPVSALLNDAKLHAIDAATGARRWEIVVGPGYNANNAVALGADGTIYVRSQAQNPAAARLYAYRDAGDRAVLRWSASVPGDSYASVSLAPDGTVYLGSDDAANGHRLFAFDPATGAVKWSLRNDQAVYTAAAIDGAGNVYYGTLSSGRLYSVTPGGTLRWTYAGASVGTSSSPALSPDGRTAYFAGYDSKLHAVDTTTGAARWTFTLGQEVRASSPAVDANGIVYLGCYDGLIYAVNPDGTLRRTWATGGIVRSSPAIAGTKLVVGSNDRRVYAFELGVGTAGPWPQYRHNARRTGRAETEPFGLLAAPTDQRAVLTLPFSLSVTISGSGPFSYQWFQDGRPVAGATQATFTVAAATAASAGNYVVRVTGPLGELTSNPARVSVEPPDPGRLTNLSVRTRAGAGARTLTAGFTLAGSGLRPMLLRGIGPGLAAFGVAGTLADPALELYAAGRPEATNDDWGAGGGGTLLAAAFARAGAFALDPAARDAALLRPLGAGNYTVQVTAPGGAAEGVALVELYEDPAGTSAANRLVNLSARAQVGTGEGILIAGFTLSGNVPRRVLIRGIGPALAGFGVTGALTNPVLTLFRGPTRVQENDDWGGEPALVSAFTAAGAFPLNDPAGRDAAFTTLLAPGSYTVQVAGSGGGTGVALVELYELP